MAALKKCVVPLLTAILVLLAQPDAKAASDPDIAAKSAVLVEVRSGTVLYEKDKGERCPPDSLTKVLTVYLAASAIESGSLSGDELVTMTQTAWYDVTQNSSSLNIRPGETMTLLELMYCAYLGSAAEACNMIAERFAGSTEAFIEIMNSYAMELGCTNTNFTTAHGQYSTRQYTTAWDQYLIYRAALNSPLFCEISGTYRHTVAETNASPARKLTSPNYLLNSDSKYYYRYCLDGRPSASYEGGYSLVAHAEHEDSILISVVLGSDAIIAEDQSTLMRNLSETKRLFEWGFSEFSWRALLSDRELVAKAPVTYGDGADYVNLRPQSSIMMFLDNSISDDEFLRNVTVFSVENGEKLYAPIEAGTVLGELILTRGGINYGTVKLIANTSVSLHRLEYIRSQFVKLLSSTAVRVVFAVLTVLLAAYIGLVIRYNRLRRAKLKKAAEAKKKIIEERKNTVMK